MESELLCLMFFERKADLGNLNSVVENIVAPCRSIFTRSFKYEFSNHSCTYSQISRICNKGSRKEFIDLFSFTPHGALVLHEIQEIPKSPVPLLLPKTLSAVRNPERVDCWRRQSAFAPTSSRLRFCCL